MSKAPKFIVRTEVWATGVKAVVRTPAGTFVGATNQTQTVTPVIVGR